MRKKFKRRSLDKKPLSEAAVKAKSRFTQGRHAPDDEVVFMQVDRDRFPGIMAIPGMHEMIMRAAKGEPVSTVISYDEVVGDDTKLINLLPDKRDFAESVENNLCLQMVNAALDRLKRDARDPRLAKILGKRMRGETLDKISHEKRFSVTRERIRQLENKAELLMLLDPAVREIAQSLNDGAMTPLQNKAVAIDYLLTFGFTKKLIVKWGIRGFPGFLKLKAASIAIAEAIYPLCVAEGREQGDDQLSQVKLDYFLSKVRTERINDLCKRIDDLKELMHEVRDYVASRLPKKLPGRFSGLNELDASKYLHKPRKQLDEL